MLGKGPYLSLLKCCPDQLLSGFVKQGVGRKGMSGKGKSGRNKDKGGAYCKRKVQKG